MSAIVETLLFDLKQIDSLDASERRVCFERAKTFRSATDEQIVELFGAMLACDAPHGGGLDDALVATVLREIAQRDAARSASSHEPPFDADVCSTLAALYRHLGPASRSRYHLLGMLTATGADAELGHFAELVATDPPGEALHAVAPFLPLFRREDYDPAALFPRLLDGLSHVNVAASILDLTNFLTRNHRVSAHPAAGRKDQLTRLLGGVVSRLSSIEENPEASHKTAQQLQKAIGESVVLTIALCDALAQIGDASVVGKLFQAMELKHRRVRTEAAAALARLGEKAGRRTLIELADEPVVRLRVLAYAEELGMIDEIGEQDKSPSARAQADLVSWLAEPTQVGIAPQECELVDSQTLRWPGYDEPVACYLFRYTYRLPQGDYTSIGIAGPLIHAFTADLADLSPLDIYATFAGWATEHEDITEVAADDLDDAQQAAAEALTERLSSEGYDSIETIKLGSFFGETVLVATALSEGVSGTALVDPRRSRWYPRSRRQRAIGPAEAYYIYKGRKLLRAFNPDAG